MLKVMAFIRRRANISREEFRRHYETGHAPMIRNIAPLILGYRRNYYQPQFDALIHGFHGFHGPPTGGEPYDAVTEVWLADEAALQAMYRTLRADAARVHDDEDRFLDKASLRVIVVEEVVTDLESMQSRTGRSEHGISAEG